MIGEGHRVKESRCLGCGYLMDAASQVGGWDSKPTSGDCTICLKCGHVMMFTDNISLRNMTPEEQVEIEADPRVMMVIEGIKKINNIGTH